MTGTKRQRLLYVHLHLRSPRCALCSGHRAQAVRTCTWRGAAAIAAPAATIAALARVWYNSPLQSVRIEALLGALAAYRASGAARDDVCAGLLDRVRDPPRAAHRGRLTSRALLRPPENVVCGFSTCLDARCLARLPGGRHLRLGRGRQVRAAARFGMRDVVRAPVTCTARELRVPANADGDGRRTFFGRWELAQREPFDWVLLRTRCLPVGACPCSSLRENRTQAP